MRGKLLQLCLALCDSMDYILQGSSVHGDSPGKNYWSGLSCLLPGDLPNPGIEPGSPSLQVDSLPAELQGKPHMHDTGTVCVCVYYKIQVPIPKMLLAGFKTLMYPNL